MTSRRPLRADATLQRLALFAGLCACAGVALGAVGCEEKKTSKPAPTNVTPPPPPPPPRATLDGVKLPAKVRFPEERLPSRQETVDAVVELATAIAGGRSEALAALLGESDKKVLETLVASGAWKDQAQSIKLVRVCVINETSDTGFQVGLGIEDASGAYLSAWESSGAGESLRFAALPITLELADKAEAFDAVTLSIEPLPEGPAVAAAPTLPVERAEVKPTEGQGSRGGGLRRGNNF